MIGYSLHSEDDIIEVIVRLPVVTPIASPIFNLLNYHSCSKVAVSFVPLTAKT